MLDRDYSKTPIPRQVAGFFVCDGVGRFNYPMKKVSLHLLFIYINILAGQVDYNSQIQMIFNSNCTGCHGGNHNSGLDLRSYESVMAGSNSGAVIVPYNHANSLLWQKINSGAMPPGNNPDLASEQVDLIAQWIDEGALENPALGTYNNAQIPKEYILNQNYPNPFNPVTTLRYDLPEDANVNITIYDMMGRVVKTLINDQQSAGYRFTQWNATNNAGSPVPAGLYLYMIQVGEFRQTRKMVLLK